LRKETRSRRRLEGRLQERESSSQKNRGGGVGGGGPIRYIIPQEAVTRTVPPEMSGDCGPEIQDSPGNLSFNRTARLDILNTLNGRLLSHIESNELIFKH